MSVEIASFVEEILGVNPQYKNLNIFAPGSSLPGMGGQAIATTGAANSGTDVAQDLQKSVIQFAQRYRQKDMPIEQLEEQAQKIEGLLMMTRTLSILSEQKINHLIEMLHALMETKRGSQHN